MRGKVGEPLVLRDRHLMHRLLWLEGGLAADVSPAAVRGKAGWREVGGHGAFLMHHWCVGGRVYADASVLRDGS